MSVQRRLSHGFPIDPDEPVTYVMPGDPDGDPKQSDVLFRFVYGEMVLHRPHDLWVAPTDRGRHLQDMIRTRLLAERFSPDDAAEWAYRHWRSVFRTINDLYDEHDDEWMCHEVVENARAYRDAGMPVDEAFLWVRMRMEPDYAVHCRSHGWCPEAYSLLIRLCVDQVVHSAPYTRIADTSGWVEAPIVAWRSLRYLQAGLSLAEALEQERRREAGEDVDAAVDLLIALYQEPAR